MLTQEPKYCRPKLKHSLCESHLEHVLGGALALIAALPRSMHAREVRPSFACHSRKNVFESEYECHLEHVLGGALALIAALPRSMHAREVPHGRDAPLLRSNLIRSECPVMREGGVGWSLSPQPENRER